MIGQRNGLTFGAIRPNVWFAFAMPRRHEPTSGRHGGGVTGAGNGTAPSANNGAHHGAHHGAASAGTSAGAGTGALRGLVGAGPSQVGIVGALRARDVSRPTPDDVERALANPEPIARPALRQEDAAP
jgi:hypothetical protein